MNKRGWYWDAWEKTPETLEGRGIPRGYCGRCIQCGKLGHARHHPGAVPFTGAWCDFHYRMLSVIHPLAPVGAMLWVALVAGAVYTVWRFSQ